MYSWVIESENGKTTYSNGWFKTGDECAADAEKNKQMARRRKYEIRMVAVDCYHAHRDSRQVDGLHDAGEDWVKSLLSRVSVEERGACESPERRLFVHLG